MSDVHDRLDRLESQLEQQRETIADQQETIQAQRDRIAELEADDAERSEDDAAAETEGDGTPAGAPTLNRRSALKAGGLLALLFGGVGTASADPQGQVGTANDPLNALYTRTLNGGGSTIGVDSPLDLDGNDVGLTEDVDLVMQPGLDAVEFRDTNNGHPTLRIETGDPGVLSLMNADLRVRNSNAITDNFGDAFLTINSGGPLGVNKTLDLGDNPARSSSGNPLTFETDGGTRALQLGVPGSTPDGNAAGANVVAGHETNTVDNGASGVVVGGGGSADASPGPSGTRNDAANEARSDFVTIGGGADNTTGGVAGAQDAAYATIGGGKSNIVSGRKATVSGGESNTASGRQSTVGGGFSNTVSGISGSVGGGYYNLARGTSATVGGGRFNEATKTQATVGGGVDNAAKGDYSTVAGGNNNLADGEYSTIAGGSDNEATTNHATVGGGSSNHATGIGSTITGGQTNKAGGTNATVAGGSGNRAFADNSLVAGSLARVESHSGTFVWGDGSNMSVYPDADDQVVFQAGGGMKVYTDSDTTNDTGAELPAGSGSWASLSTETAKSDVEGVNPPDVLEAVESLDVATWRYDAEDESTRHMGPMAEDFHEAFSLGHDERRISNVDADGVAFGAIQGLVDRVAKKDDRIADIEAETETLREENERLRAENERLQDHDARLKARLDRIEDELGIAGGSTTETTND